MAHTPTITDFQLYIATPLTGANWAYNLNKIVSYLTAGTEDFTLDAITTINDGTIGGDLNVTGDLIVSGIAPGIGMQDRGDPVAYDFTKPDFTIDSAWHDLDLSAIAPAGAKVIWLSVGVSSSGNAAVFFRKKGNANAFNIQRAIGIAANVLAYSLPVFCDTNRFVQYYVENSGVWTSINVSVTGWQF